MEFNSGFKGLNIPHWQDAEFQVLLGMFELTTKGWHYYYYYYYY